MDLQLGTGTLPEDITQIGLSGRFSAFRYDSKYAINLPDDEQSYVDIRAMDSYLATLMIRHYFGDGWSADVSVPTGTIRIDTRNPVTGEDNDPSYLSGFGDIVLSGRYDFTALWGPGDYRPSVALTVGMGLPTGTQAVSENPGFTGNLLALGFGVFSTRVRLEYAQSIHRLFAVKASGQLTTPLSYNEQGIRYGSSINYGLGIIWRTTDWLSVTLKATGQHMEPNVELDEGEDNPNSGGDVFAGELDLSFKLTDKLYAGANVRLPFYENLNFDGTNTQLVERFSAQIYLAAVFGGDEPEEGHDH